MACDAFRLRSLIAGHLSVLRHWKAFRSERSCPIEHHASDKRELDLRYLLSSFCHVIHCRYTWAEDAVRKPGFLLALVLAFSSAESVSWIVFLLLSLNTAFTSYCVLITSHKRRELALIIESKCHQIFFFLQPFPCYIKNSWVTAASSFQDLANQQIGRVGRNTRACWWTEQGCPDRAGNRRNLHLICLCWVCLSPVRFIVCSSLWWAMSLLEN